MALRMTHHTPRVRRKPIPRRYSTQAEAPLALGRVIERVDDGWRVQLGTAVRTLQCHPALDPALVEEAIKTGAPVVIDCAGHTEIAGVLQTSRTLTIDRAGRIDAQVDEFVVSAKRKALLKVPGSFLQLKEHEMELFANRILTRARELAKILAAMIKLN